MALSTPPIFSSSTLVRIFIQFNGYQPLLTSLQSLSHSRPAPSQASLPLLEDITRPSSRTVASSFSADSTEMKSSMTYISWTLQAQHTSHKSLLSRSTLTNYRPRFIFQTPSKPILHRATLSHPISQFTVTVDDADDQLNSTQLNSPVQFVFVHTHVHAKLKRLGRSQPEVSCSSPLFFVLYLRSLS